MINLIAEPGVVLSWEEFTNTKPPYSIALDGYVNSVSELDINGPYLNLDHHLHYSRQPLRHRHLRCYNNTPRQFRHCHPRWRLQ